jgi:Domain of unknown function (DUF4926)
MYKLLDTVALDRELPEHGLRNGDLGAIMEVYEPDGLEVVFHDRIRQKSGACQAERQRGAAGAKQRPSSPSGPPRKPHCIEPARLIG